PIPFNSGVHSSVGNLAASNDGQRLYMTISNALTTIDLKTGVRLSQLYISGATGLVISPDDQTLYIGIGYGYILILKSSDADKGVNNPIGYIIPPTYKVGG